MGSKTSSLETDCTCDYCGVDVKESNDSAARDGIEVCQRCFGPLGVAGERKEKTRPDTYINIEEKKIELKIEIKRIQILPFKETLPPEYANNEFLNEQLLLNDYLMPYFRKKPSPAQIGTRFQIQEIDFKVTSCHPPIGTINDKTIIRCMNKPLTAIQNIVRLHALPTKVSMDSACRQLSKKGDKIDRIESKELFKNYVKPYFACNSPDDEPKHIAKGELFMSRGIQFKIIAAEPWNGIVNSATQIFTEGEPLVDIERIHLLPIYETLPNSDKKITEEKVLDKYLRPYFIGQHQYVSRDEDIRIDGVDFKIMGVAPEAGLVTLNTTIHNNGSPIHADDLKNQRLADDEALARRLQQQEGSIMRVSLQSGDDVRAGIQAFLALASNGNEAQHRALLERIQREHIIHLQGSNAGGGSGNTGASNSEIAALPTRQWKEDAPTGPIEEKDKEHLTCNVCLMEYDKGEWLRTLPCFHSYHKECIDKWLSSNNKCPMCKHPVS